MRHNAGLINSWFYASLITFASRGDPASTFSVTGKKSRHVHLGLKILEFNGKSEDTMHRHKKDETMNELKIISTRSFE